MNVKYCLENFSFYDHTGIARHLEKMAAKGWLLENAGHIWKYRAIEPKQVAFTVTYCAHASVFDPEPSEEQQKFIDLCAHTGWVAVRSLGQMAIFYNEDPDAPPLNTEPTVELEGMHRAMKKNFLPATILLLLYYAFQLYAFFGRQRGIAMLLTSSISLGLAVGLSMLLLYHVSQLAGYFLYRRKALQLAETGLLLDVPPLHTRMIRLWLALTYAGLLLLAADVLLHGNHRERSFLLLALAVAAIELTVVFTILWLLKKLRVDPGVSRILYSVSSFIIIFALLTFSRNNMADLLPQPPQIPIPFSLSAYDGKDYGPATAQRGATFLSEYITVSQSLPGNSGMEYTLTTARNEKLAAAMARSVYKGTKNIRLNSAITIANRYDPVDPTPWQADEVYQRTFGGGPIPEYFVRWGDTVLDVAYWNNATTDDDIPDQLRDMLIETFKP